MASPRNPWMAFRDYFALAENEGIDLTVAAEELLKGAKASQPALKIAGLRRQWDLPSEAEVREWGRAESRWQTLARDHEELPGPLEGERSTIEAEMSSLRSFLEAKCDWRERLPRDPQLRVVPRSAWALVESVKPDLTSGWVDDPEDPEEFISVEWLPGTITSQIWCEYEAYEALCVDRTQARDLIKLLAGRADRRGAPRGPRDPDVKLAVERVLSAIANDGDTRQVGKIAWDYLPPEVKRSERGDLMHRSVKRHVLAKIQGAKNEGR